MPEVVNSTDKNMHGGLYSLAPATSDQYATIQEATVTEEFQTTDSFPQTLSSFHQTSKRSHALGNSYSTYESTTSILNITSETFQHERTKFPWIYNSSDSYNLTNDNASANNFLEYQEEYTNRSDLYERTLFTDSSSNFTFNSSNEYTRDLANDTFSSGEATFNFNLTTWFTLIPQNIPENVGVGSDNEDDLSFVIFKVFILAFISLVGSFGNVMVIWSVIKESHLHRPPFYFLLSLGVTDLSRAVFCLPVVITTVLNGSRWRHGESACKLFAFATSFFVFSSALSLLAIAIDRHISIVYSKTYRRRSLGIANLVAAIVIWIIAFSASFPPVVGIGDYVFIPEEAQCSYQHKNYKYNDSVSSVLVFVAILFLTYFLYFRIFRFLRAHRRMRPLQHTPALSTNWAFVGPGANGQAFINWLNGFGGQVPARQGGQRTVQRLNFGRVVNLSTAKNEHLTRLFLILTLVFGITWSPYVILSMWRIFFDASLIPSSYVTVSAWLGYGQLAMCPVIYLLVRVPLRKPSRTMYAQAEKREFLLENKIGK